ncbi:hypothetical protein PVT68_10955 [Microbulbifer bruguierae]|uniref:Uncharacterized protein n=1 Tax=Microbulbifer bruguierae TaxID=3029061 RepID=A0ABY8NCY3_9GAMM|nr:hypothetical protein [Microbulbifer bruguierae]WGL15288.1 hypothetical protein PVT68_10955 [Microbulbifer bruguierae]
MTQQRFIPVRTHRLLLVAIGCMVLMVNVALGAQSEDRTADSADAENSDSSAAGERQPDLQYPGWHVKSRLGPDQWVGSWLISRDGEAQHVWSLNRDGTGRSYAFTQHGDKMQFAYGYDIRWYFDPFTQMANIKTERRIVCRGGRMYPYFLTLKSYESDYAVKGKYAWQTTWTEASIGRNYLHKSLVVFLAPLSAWHNPKKDEPCPQFPRMDIEKDIDTALDKWDAEAARDEQLVDTSPAEGEPEFVGEEFGPAAKGAGTAASSTAQGKLPKQRKGSAKARVKDRSAAAAKPKKRRAN